MADAAVKEVKPSCKTGLTKNYQSSIVRITEN